jgi:hypothetical protein
MGDELYITRLVEKPEGKRPLRRPKSGWEINIRMHVREIRRESEDWIHLAHDWDQSQTLVSTVMNLEKGKVVPVLELSTTP